MKECSHKKGALIGCRSRVKGESPRETHPNTGMTMFLLLVELFLLGKSIEKIYVQKL